MMVTSLVAIEAHRTGKIITNALHFLKEEKIWHKIVYSHCI